MENSFIRKQIKNLTKNDINNFALKEGINLTTEELDIIYEFLMNNSERLLEDDYRGVLEKLKEQVSVETYSKIEDLYLKFKNKLNRN